MYLTLGSSRIGLTGDKSVDWFGITDQVEIVKED